MVRARARVIVRQRDLGVETEDKLRPPHAVLVLGVHLVRVRARVRVRLRVRLRLRLRVRRPRRAPG